MNQINDKLTVITRSDIDPGYQATQSVHAGIQFIFEHPDRAGPWYKDSNYLALLSAKDENHLKEIILDCHKHNIKHSVFTEPDIDNQITSVAIEPGEKTRKITSRLPLLLKQK